MSPTDVYEALEAAANERIRDHERSEAKYNLKVSMIWAEWRKEDGEGKMSEEDNEREA